MVAGIRFTYATNGSTTMDEYVNASDDVVVEGAVEPGRFYEERDFNKTIEIRAREAHRVSLVMGMIGQRERALVFCATQLDALAVHDLINQMSTTTVWLSWRRTTEHSSRRRQSGHAAWVCCSAWFGVDPGYRPNELSSP